MAECDKIRRIGSSNARCVKNGRVIIGKEYVLYTDAGEYWIIDEFGNRLVPSLEYKNYWEYVDMADASGYNKFLTLINEREFYDRFTDDMRMNYSYHTMRTKFYYTAKRFVKISGSRPLNEPLFNLCFSHYCEEVYGFNVSTDCVRSFIENKYQQPDIPDYINDYVSAKSSKTPFKEKGYGTYQVFQASHEYCKGNYYILMGFQDTGKNCLDFVKINNLTHDEAINKKSRDDIFHVDTLIPTDMFIHDYYNSDLNTEPASAFKQEYSNKPKESNMNPKKVIESVTTIFVFEKDASTLTDDQIFDSIQKVEAEIKRLEGIEAKPDKLNKRLGELRVQVEALVKYVDSRDSDS